MLLKLGFALAVITTSTLADEVVELSPHFEVNILIDKIEDFLSFKINIGSPITYMYSNVYNGQYAPAMHASDAFRIAMTDNRFDVKRYDGRRTKMSTAVYNVGLQFQPHGSPRKSPMCLTTDPLPRFGYAHELGLGPIKYKMLAPRGSYQAQDFIMLHNSNNKPVIHFTETINRALVELEPSCANPYVTLPVDHLDKFSIAGSVVFGDSSYRGSMVLETIHNYFEIPPYMLETLRQSIADAFHSSVEISKNGNKDIYIVKNCHRDSFNNQHLVAQLPVITFKFNGVEVRLGPGAYLDANSEIGGPYSCTLLVRSQAHRGQLTVGQPFLRRSIIGIHRETTPNRVSVCDI